MNPDQSSPLDSPPITTSAPRHPRRKRQQRGNRLLPEMSEKLECLDLRQDIESEEYSHLEVKKIDTNSSSSDTEALESVEKPKDLKNPKPIESHSSINQKSNEKGEEHMGTSLETEGVQVREKNTSRPKVILSLLLGMAAALVVLVAFIVYGWLLKTENHLNKTESLGPSHKEQAATNGYKIEKIFPGDSEYSDEEIKSTLPPQEIMYEEFDQNKQLVTEFEAVYINKNGLTLELSEDKEPTNNHPSGLIQFPDSELELELVLRGILPTLLGDSTEFIGLSERVNALSMRSTIKDSPDLNLLREESKKIYATVEGNSEEIERAKNEVALNQKAISEISDLLAMLKQSIPELRKEQLEIRELFNKKESGKTKIKERIEKKLHSAQVEKSSSDKPVKNLKVNKVVFIIRGLKVAYMGSHAAMIRDVKRKSKQVVSEGTVITGLGKVDRLDTKTATVYVTLEDGRSAKIEPTVSLENHQKKVVKQ